MFRSNDLGFAKRQYEQLSDSDISKRYANREAYFEPPTSWLGRILSSHSIEDKLARLQAFYPYQRDISETRRGFEE